MTARPSPRRRHAPPASNCFNVFGYAFGFVTHSALAQQFIHSLYGAFAVADADVAATFSLAERRTGQGRIWDVRLGEQQLASQPSLGAVLGCLEYEVSLRVLAHRPDLIALHSATASAASSTALITGASGTGKSTLALALAARGYRVGSDDIALLTPHTGEVQPLPRCFHLDIRSRRLLRYAGLRMPEKATRHGFMTPTDLGMTVVPTPPVRLLLLLVRGNGCRPHLMSLTQAEMMVLMLSEIGWGEHSASETLAALGRLVSGAACYRLTSGRLRATTDIVARLLGSA